jgi:hypothetical protein
MSLAETIGAGTGIYNLKTLFVPIRVREDLCYLRKSISVEKRRS